jgi:O-antigen ligase
MGGFIQPLLVLVFQILLFFVPLAIWPTTSEIFEFNKIVLVYLGTGLITTLWLAKMIVAKKWIFRRTILDIPILIFLFSQFLSTIFSIDIRTSLFGYYSRFNGGLISLLCYTLLYFAWVSNINRKETIKSLKITFVSAFLVTLYAILEHFGIDKDIWIQDVVNRVFSTLGQPNWLAAWVVALIPVGWASLSLNRSKQRKHTVFWLVISFMLLLTLFYTKSRSGLLGLGGAYLVFSVFTFFNDKKSLKRTLLILVSVIALAILTKATWIQNIKLETASIPALEAGGTESGDIRKIVWKGALSVWTRHPVFGTGVETFAYSYYKERPVEHNLVSEWDFLYNKAHNEYLNFLATTGTVGTIAYLSLTIFTLYFLLRSKSEYNIAFLAGYVSILLTNFFGFSVTPINLLFYLFPAFAFSLSQNENEIKNNNRTADNWQKYLIAFLCLIEIVLFYKTITYWYADTLYARGKSLYDQGKFTQARSVLGGAIKRSPYEAIYWNKYAQSTTGMALELLEANNQTAAAEMADYALLESQRARVLSPRSVNIRRDQTTLLIKLSVFDKKLLEEAKISILQTIDLAPTDAKLFYNLGLTYMRLGQNDKAIATFEETIKMKPNYKEAHLAHALLLADMGRKDEAVAELKFILEKIDPNDELTRTQLMDLTK